MSEDSDFQFSEGELDENKHAKIVENVLTLNKAQHLKKAARTELSTQISEFNLVKSTGKISSINIDDLGNALIAKKKHANINRKLKLAEKKGHTLPRPLEKPQAERFKRSIGYEKNRYLFDRWEAFVTANRGLSHQVFPLEKVGKLSKETKKAQNFTSNWILKSDLQKDLEGLNTGVEEYKIETEDTKNELPLTLAELKEKRKEAAKLRMHQSFKEAKARRQKKIKSKKYHRILRKEMIKQKLKEFEELEKTDPEKALKKLEEIEKTRALERFTLRHRGTSNWAKNKQVRAKYNKESRQILAEQLQISRDLTHKHKQLHDSEDEDSDNEVILKPNVLNKNPWIKGSNRDNEITNFVNEYKNFWSEQSTTGMTHTDNHEKIGNDLDNNTTGNINTSKITLEKENTDGSKSENEECSENINPDTYLDDKETFSIITKTKSPPECRFNSSSGDWDIEEIFINAKREMSEKLKKKLLKKEKREKKMISTKINNKANKRIKPDKKSKKVDLTIIPKRKKQIIDEELREIPLHQEQGSEDASASNLKNIIQNNSTVEKQLLPSINISTDSFIKPKPSELDSVFPDLLSVDENMEENPQKNLIIETFEDNDILDDFAKEKQEELHKDKPHSIDLNLPGWGSWAGSGINPQKQRNRRNFIIQMPKATPRKDSNCSSLIINEKNGVNIRSHLVSDVPFPFKSIKDYEASIRAPIGNTFVPELAYRRFIKPSVQVKMGTIIEPATTSLLMGKPNN